MQKYVPRTNQVTLSNDLCYPFNNSQEAVWIGEQPDAEYTVCTELVWSDGPVEELQISDKARNGFKLAFTGSASNARVRFVLL